VTIEVMTKYLPVVKVTAFLFSCNSKNFLWVSFQTKGLHGNRRTSIPNRPLPADFTSHHRSPFHTRLYSTGFVHFLVTESHRKWTAV